MYLQSLEEMQQCVSYSAKTKRDGRTGAFQYLPSQAFGGGGGGGELIMRVILLWKGHNCSRHFCKQCVFEDVHSTLQ